MYYTRLQVTCDPEFTEILMAEVGLDGYDTFMETEQGFEAYTDDGRYDRKVLAGVQEKYMHVKPLLFRHDRLEKKNWNEEWEKNVEPVVVDHQVLIRAGFHKIKKKYPYEIIITPKMSFGTGHHPTTCLMLKNQLQIDHEGKRTMDVGCGTGILSIMASLRKAREIEAFDIDEWSVLNAKENIAVNGCTNIRISQAKVIDLKFDQPFEIIMANINTNILLQEMGLYSSNLTTQGILLISGFYPHDFGILKEKSTKYQLEAFHEEEMDGWASLAFRKAP